MDKYPIGSFGWVDLCTRDDKSAVGFYSELFNWKDDESANAENGYYHQMNLEEKPMTGIYPMVGEEAQNIPPHWTSYILVEDADEITSIAKSNGATILHEPIDIYTFGRLALLTDPAGVGFGLWQPKDHVAPSLWEISMAPSVGMNFSLRTWKGRESSTVTLLDGPSELRNMAQSFITSSTTRITTWVE